MEKYGTWHDGSTYKCRGIRFYQFVSSYVSFSKLFMTLQQCETGSLGHSENKKELRPQMVFEALFIASTTLDDADVLLCIDTRSICGALDTCFVN